MSKIKILKEQHPHLNVGILDLLIETDPSDTNKYLHFLIKELHKISNGKENTKTFLANAILRGIYGEANMNALLKLDRYCRTKILNVDISTLKDFTEVLNYVAQGEEFERMKELENQATIWFSDDDWIVLTPHTFECSQMYGKGTKWCTTNLYSWHEYTRKLLVYIISKKRSTQCKWAIYIKSATEISFWDEKDKKTDSLMIPMSEKVRSVLVYIISNFTGYSNERIKKHFSTDYVMMDNRYYEISKLKKGHALDILNQFVGELSDDDKMRKEKVSIRIETADDDGLILTKPTPRRKIFHPSAEKPILYKEEEIIDGYILDRMRKR